MKLFLKLSLFVIIISVAGCKKSNNSNSSIPVVAVDFTLYTNIYPKLNGVGGWIYVPNVGVRGILVHRQSTDVFKAYDRNCTYQSSNPCATVYVDATNILAVDTCCHSKFYIYDGSVTQGPATLSLKAYNTTFDGNVLHVYN